MIDSYREHASNERTFLAWVRTVIAIIGFGLVATRFNDQATTYWTEVLMMGAGALVLMLAYIRMRRMHRRIASKKPTDDYEDSADVFLLVLVASLFTLLGAFVMHVY
ncbi:YidH family protein [Ruegeria hyattellae]|uniref:YidH family protein n=1 Tax=Ruegeria hyattellae TaxID=3233337 RepID=UPI00355C4829